MKNAKHYFLTKIENETQLIITNRVKPEQFKQAIELQSYKAEVRAIDPEKLIGFNMQTWILSDKAEANILNLLINAK